jgi:hypothetical protein
MCSFIRIFLVDAMQGFSDKLVAISSVRVGIWAENPIEIKVKNTENFFIIQIFHKYKKSCPKIEQEV